MPIIEGIVKFKTEDFERDKEFFRGLKEGQKPHTFYVGCSDRLQNLGNVK